MVSELDNKEKMSRAESNGATSPALPNGMEAAAPLDHNIPIGGRFDQYRSSFWAAALAIIGVRYAPRPFLKLTGHFDNKSIKTKKDFALKHGYSAFAGLVMEGVTGYFAKKTRSDMQSIFAEAIGWELDKDPKDVTFNDFRNSKNTIVHQTVSNYTYRTAMRALVNSVFFLPYALPLLTKMKVLKGDWHHSKWSSETGVDLGIAANAAYLYKDVLSRKMSSFESLQAIIDLKINQADNPGDIIAVNDLLDIYERNAAKSEITSFLKYRGTPQWDRSMAIFTRMADLMNQTYKNVATKEQADFGMPKFIYMAGNNLIHPERVEQTLAYIGVANRYGIPALKKVVKSVSEGMPVNEALKEYPVTIPPIPSAEAYQGTAEPRKALDRNDLMKRPIQPVSLLEQAARPEMSTGLTH